MKTIEQLTQKVFTGLPQTSTKILAIPKATPLKNILSKYSRNRIKHTPMYHQEVNRPTIFQAEL